MEKKIYITEEWLLEKLKKASLSEENFKLFKDFLMWDYAGGVEFREDDGGSPFLEGLSGDNFILRLAKDNVEIDLDFIFDSELLSDIISILLAYMITEDGFEGYMRSKDFFDKTGVEAPAHGNRSVDMSRLATILEKEGFNIENVIYALDYNGIIKLTKELNIGNISKKVYKKKFRNLFSYYKNNKYPYSWEKVLAFHESHPNYFGEVRDS